MNHIHRIPSMRQVMTPFPYHIDIGASLAQAQEMMHTHGIRHLPVTRHGDIESIISARDLERFSGPGHRPDDELLVQDACPTRAYCVDVSDPLDQVLLAMCELHIGAAVVLKDGALAGIFTETDAFRFIAKELQDHYGPTEPEAA